MTDDLVARFVKRFTGGAAIDIDLRQSASCFNVTALFGPSGCGKTTLLRCLAGLTDPDDGVIEFCDQTWFAADRKIAKSPQERDIGFLFQDYALFPHLTVADNIEFGLRSFSTKQRRERSAQMLELLDLSGLERRKPAELSGGQQQRVALARALARRPKLLLLDEPLSALDSILREQLRIELRRILGELGIPTLLVTHDRMEAIVLADRVALMIDGKIQQIGSVRDIFSRPNSAELAQLIGIETIVSGEIVEVRDGLATVQVGATRLIAVAPTTAAGRQVHVCIKGEDVALQLGAFASGSVRNHLAATIQSMTPEGPLIRVRLNCGFELTSLVTRPACEELQLAVGDQVTALVKAPAIHLVPHESIVGSN